jgi:hypothetical protein
VLTEYLVNMMLSLFTPSKVFAMDNDDLFTKYEAELRRYRGEMNDKLENKAVGCWRWLTTSSALMNKGREKPMMQLLTKAIANEIDDKLINAIGNEQKIVMVPGNSGWDDIYKTYRTKVIEIMKKEYSTNPPEDEKECVVHDGILRRVEWVTMNHPNRLEPPYPLLTKSVLPLAADALKRVENAIIEVSSHRLILILS